MVREVEALELVAGVQKATEVTTATACWAGAEAKMVVVVTATVTMEEENAEEAAVLGVAAVS